jgi:hypothetical protein
MYDTPSYNELKIIGIQDTRYFISNHGPHKGIESTNIQRKQHKI